MNRRRRASDAVLKRRIEIDGMRRGSATPHVRAHGRTAAEMLAMLTARLGNDPAREIQIAAAEQAKITALRLV